MFPSGERAVLDSWIHHTLLLLYKSPRSPGAARRQVEEAKQRERHELERSRNINEARQAERKAERVLSQDGEQTVRWQQSLAEDQREEEERKHRADRLRAERQQVRRGGRERSG